MSASTLNKISKTSKLGTLSWSLQAVTDCPGSVGVDGQLVPACSGCYATAGCYNFPDTKKVRADNKKAWQEADWVEVMVKALRKQSHFRWFDSGDVYALQLAEKMLQIMTATPNTKHWLPTRMAKFPKFQPVLAKMQSLPNVMVRFSSDAVDGTFSPAHGSTILPEATSVPSGVTLCRAPEQGGKCLDCRACYAKDVPVIGYVAHGKKMAKVIRLTVV
ncbi:MAG: GP88 family protein [Algoriphagus sp.]